MDVIYKKEATELQLPLLKFYFLLFNYAPFTNCTSAFT